MPTGLLARLGIGLAALIALGLAIAAIRHSGYVAGRDAEKARWEEAAKTLRDQAQQSAGKADSAAAAREVQYAEALGREKEKIDAAVKAGDSPLDVLFPAQ